MGDRRQVIAFGVRGEGAGEDFVAEVLGGATNGRAGIGETADELRGFGRFGGVCAEGEADEVVEDEDLAVTVGAGTDADGGDGDGAGDVGGDLARDAFEDERDGAGTLEGMSIGEELVDGGGGATLDAVAAPCGAGIAE